MNPINCFAFRLSTASLATLIAFALTSCGSSDGGSGGSSGIPAYVDQVLQGKFSSSNWTYAGGRALKESDGKWNVELTSDTLVNACDQFNLQASNKLKIYVTLPSLAIARTDFALKTGGTLANFIDSNPSVPQNSLTDNGFFEVTAVSPGSFDAKLVASFDDNNTVNGKLTAIKCCAKPGDSFSYQVCTE